MSGRMITNVFLTLLLVCGLSLVGCARATVYQMDSGERTAGAEGELSVTRDNNGNQMLQLKVAHLPLPSRLDESMSTYVVWIAPEGSNSYYNMGQLRLAQNRTGQVNFTTPFRSFNMMVTAEVDGQVMSPSNQVVLRRAVGATR